VREHRAAAVGEQVTRSGAVATASDAVGVGAGEQACGADRCRVRTLVVRRLPREELRGAPQPRQRAAVEARLAPGIAAAAEHEIEPRRDIGVALSAGPPAAAAPVAEGSGPWYIGAGIGSAMIFVLFTYGGWNDAAYISAEVRNRERNMVRALLIAISLVALLYLLVNLAYLKGLGYDAMARSNAVAADLLKAVWGPTGEKLIAVMIAVAALTSVNGSMIVGARSNYALGRDWPLLGYLGRWHEASGSPRNAMLVQGAIALALVGLGAVQKSGFKALVEYSLPVFWGFFLLTGIALFVLRSKEPAAPRPFRVPLYPVLPALFVLMCGYLLYASLTYHKDNALVGLVVLAAGAVVLFFAKQKNK